MTYTFKGLVCHNRLAVFKTLKAGFARRSAAVAVAYDYFISHGYTIICEEIDNENDAVDFMTTQGDEMFQFAVEPERLNP